MAQPSRKYGLGAQLFALLALALSFGAAALVILASNRDAEATARRVCADHNMRYEGFGPVSKGAPVTAHCQASDLHDEEIKLPHGGNHFGGTFGANLVALVVGYLVLTACVTAGWLVRRRRLTELD